MVYTDFPLTKDSWFAIFLPTPASWSHIVAAGVLAAKMVMARPACVRTRSLRHYLFFPDHGCQDILKDMV